MPKVLLNRDRRLFPAGVTLVDQQANPKGIVLDIPEHPVAPPGPALRLQQAKRGRRVVGNARKRVGVEVAKRRWNGALRIVGVAAEDAVDDRLAIGRQGQSPPNPRRLELRESLVEPNVVVLRDRNRRDDKIRIRLQPPKIGRLEDHQIEFARAKLRHLRGYVGDDFENDSIELRLLPVESRVGREDDVTARNHFADLVRAGADRLLPVEVDLIGDPFGETVRRKNAGIVPQQGEEGGEWRLEMEPYGQGVDCFDRLEHRKI